MTDILIKIITPLIALYGAVLSTYALVRERPKTKLNFEFGFIADYKRKTAFPYCCLYIQNLSRKTIFVKDYGFVTQNKHFLPVDLVEHRVLEGLTKSQFNNDHLLSDIVCTNEQLKFVGEKDHILPFEGVYAFFDLDKLKIAIRQHKCKKIFAQFSDGHMTVRKKLNLSKVLSLKTASDEPLSKICNEHL